MSELLTRTLSGAVLLVVLLGSILLSPWIFSGLMLFVVVVGAFEMARLQSVQSKLHLIIGEACVVFSFVFAALVALKVLSQRWLLLELPLFMFPFLIALFSKGTDFRQISSFIYGSYFYLSLPCSLMVFMYSPELFGNMAGVSILIMIFALIWTNDIFAYLTGRLLGKHKLFPRISPGKTIEGSIGGLLFTILAIAIISHYVSWLSTSIAIGLAIISVVFGSLGDLCESMLKRQAGVKDSGKLIPGHGGILDRFDSVLFSVPFVFVYLLLV